MNKKTLTDVVVVGFALFAMFFGAGNLIFPPSLGLMAGDKWGLALIGFLLTGVGMPLLGILAVSKSGGSMEKFAGKVSPTFAKILGTVIMLAIGPLLAIPRTGATTFEMGIQPIFPNASPIIVSVVFFAITLLFVISPSKVIDSIGKVLTPVLLITIGVIIFKGVTTPVGEFAVTNLANPFSTGFTEGYQTMDALGSIVLTGIVISGLIAKGYTERKEQMKLTVLSGIVAATGLLLVYGGLMYLGATAVNVFPADMAKTDLIINITSLLLGDWGKIALGLVVGLACLTTAIGLTATAGEFFSKLSNNKLSYRTVVILITLFSAIVSNAGVETIVKFAVPLLVTVYPVAIALIVLSIFDSFIKRRGVYIGAVFGALLVSLFDALAAIGINITSVQGIINMLPFSNQGFGWIAPAVACALIGALIFRNEVSIQS
ncbi:MAG: brnQ [Clostridia bacterium]|jgi:LIVCS family branched-chain amino acid:cation transporter|nr:brnQ [Clostridia bacterium]